MDFLTTKEAAEFLKYSEQRLAEWRAKGIGPKFYKPVDKVFYLKEDLIDWVKSSAVENKGE